MKISFARAFWRLFRGYWRSEEKKRAVGLLAVVVAMNFAMVYLLVQLNKWYNEPPIPFSEVADSMPSPDTLTVREYALWQKRRPSDMGFDDIAKRVLGKGSYFNTRLVHADRVAPTVCAANYNVLYDAPRHMTSTELRLVASFPLDYSCGSSKLGFIVGMSVAPVQMAHIASAIKAQWFTKGGSLCSQKAP